MREAAGASTLIRVRIDSAGDCTRMMRTINRKGAQFIIKGKTTPDLCTAIYGCLPGAGALSMWTLTGSQPRRY